MILSHTMFKVLKYIFPESVSKFKKLKIFFVFYFKSCLNLNLNRYVKIQAEVKQQATNTDKKVIIIIIIKLMLYEQ